MGVLSSENDLNKEIHTKNSKEERRKCLGGAQREEAGHWSEGLRKEGNKGILK